MKTQTFGCSDYLDANIDLPCCVYCFCREDEDLRHAHEEKENNWTMVFVKAAYNNYRSFRENGEVQDSPSGELKFDGQVEWEQHPSGKRRFFRVKYTEGPTDKLWMEEKDLNYLTRLAREGTLMQKESTWREVLGKWEPESKRIAAIARVEFEIKARAEVERKAEDKRINERIINVAEPLVQLQDEAFEQLLREQRTEQEAFQNTPMQQLQEQQALFKQFQNQQKQITQQLQEQQDQLKSQFEFFTQQLQANQPALKKEFTEQQIQKQLEDKTSEHTTHFNNKTSGVTATIAQPKPV